MKRIIALVVAVLVLATATCLAETSATDEFLANLSATWDSLVKMGDEAVNSASNWISNDLPDWVNNELPAWAEGAAQSISSWLEGAGKWTEEAASNLKAFIDENGPAVEAWLSQAGEDIQTAWETLTHPDDHTEEDLQTAYETVMDGLNAEADAPGAEIANPWVDLTEAELRQASGVEFALPEDARDVVYRWLEAESLAEMQFTLDGDEYCARIAPAALEEGELMNISGMYFDWEYEEDITVGHCRGTIGLAQTGSEDWVELCQWYDLAPGLMYSLSVYTPDPDGLDLTAVAEMVYVPMQGDA